MKHQYHVVRKGKKIGTIICKRRGCQLELPHNYPSHMKPRSGCPTAVFKNVVTPNTPSIIKPGQIIT